MSPAPKPKYVGYRTRIDWPTPELAALIALLPPGKALDIGCGHGTEAIFLGSYGWQVVAFDQPEDRDGKVDHPVDAAIARLKSAPKPARKNVTFVKAKLEQFVVPEPGTYSLVIDRLVDNTWVDSSSGPSSARQRRRHRIIKMAAEALRPGGLFLLRFGFPEAFAWQMPNDGAPLHRRDLALAQDYFDVGREVGFTALVSPANEPDNALSVERYEMSLVVLVRRPADPSRISGNKGSLRNRGWPSGRPG